MVVMAQVNFVVTPDDAKVTVDGKSVSGGAVQVALKDNKPTSIKVVAKASGYKTLEKKFEITGDSEVPITLEKKRRSGGGGGGGGGGGSGPGDKIDL
jgi:hypothetical protein